MRQQQHHMYDFTNFIWSVWTLVQGSRRVQEPHLYSVPGSRTKLRHHHVYYSRSTLAAPNPCDQP